MDTGLLHLHNILRWIILLLLLVTIFQAFSKKEAIRKTSLWLLISAHIMFLIGLYQVIAGRYGITKGLPPETNLMEESGKFFRFFWIEHPLAMIVAIILITISRRKAKNLNYKATSWLLVIALLFILAAVPWPFRNIVGRPWFPGMN